MWRCTRSLRGLVSVLALGVCAGCLWWLARCLVWVVCSGWCAGFGSVWRELDSDMLESTCARIQARFCFARLESTFGASLAGRKARVGFWRRIYFCTNLARTKIHYTKSALCRIYFAQNPLLAQIPHRFRAIFLSFLLSFARVLSHFREADRASSHALG